MSAEEELKTENERLKTENTLLKQFMDSLESDFMVKSNQDSNILLRIRSCKLDPIKFFEQSKPRA